MKHDAPCGETPSNRKVPLNIYLISQGQNKTYLDYKSAVVAASREDAARRIHPRDGEQSAEWNDKFWCSGPEQVVVKYLGVAADSVPAGVVCAEDGIGVHAKAALAKALAEISDNKFVYVMTDDELIALKSLPDYDFAGKDDERHCYVLLSGSVAPIPLRRNKPGEVIVKHDGECGESSSSRKVPLNIYLISQGQNKTYLDYKSAVVVASHEDAARRIHPRDGEQSAEWNDKFWCSGPEQVEVKYVGVAADSVPAGVVCTEGGVGLDAA